MSRSPVSLDYLADGDWTDRAPAMVQSVLIEAFENSKVFKAVGPDSLDLRASQFRCTPRCGVRAG